MNKTLSEQMDEIKSIIHLVDDKKLIHNMTDSEWQEKFNILKLISPPTREKKLTRRSTHVRILNRSWSLSKGNSDGIDSLDKRYCDFINDVLKNIRTSRKNKVICDYCYHIYQVAELLRFEPELNTRLIHNDGMDCFEVWLEK